MFDRLLKDFNCLPFGEIGPRPLSYPPCDKANPSVQILSKAEGDRN